MYSSWQSRVQALRETFGYNNFTGNFLELHVRLQCLYRLESTDARDADNTTHLQQLLEKCNEVCPLVHAVE